MPPEKYIDAVNETHSDIEGWQNITYEAIKNEAPKTTYHPIIAKIQKIIKREVRKYMAAQKFIGEMTPDDFVKADGSLTTEGQLWNDLFELINSEIKRGREKKTTG